MSNAADTQVRNTPVNVAEANPAAGAPANLRKRAEDRPVDQAGFDYRAAAELFPTRGRKARRPAMKYRRFARAADAIRFAIEELPAEALLGAFLEVDEKRFGGDGIRALYESERYPLARRKRG